MQKKGEICYNRLRLFFATESPMRLPFHHLPYADDAAIADHMDQINAGGIG